MLQTEQITEQKEQQSWLLSKWGVLVTLFVIAGVLGLPVLFKSNAFSKKGKIALTVLVLIYSAVIILLTIVIAIWLFRFMREAFNI